MDAAEKAQQRDPVKFRLSAVDEIAVVACYHGNQRHGWSIMRGHHPAPVDMVRWLLARLVELEGRVEHLEEERRALVTRVGMLEVVAMAGMP